MLGTADKQRKSPTTRLADKPEKRLLPKTEFDPPKSSILGRFCPTNFEPFFLQVSARPREPKRRPRKPENSDDEAQKPPKRSEQQKNSKKRPSQRPATWRRNTGAPSPPLRGHVVVVVSLESQTCPGQTEGFTLPPAGLFLLTHSARGSFGNRSGTAVCRKRALAKFGD